MFTRRKILLASSAAGFAPLLRPFTSTAFAQPGAAPTRIVFVYAPNGVVQKNFWPTGTDLTEQPILAPLAPHAKDMVLVRGMGFTGFNTPHSMGTTKALTARDVFGAGDKDKPVAARGVMDMPSLDHLLSKSVGARNFRPVLRLGGHWGNNRGYLMFGDKGEVLAPIGKVEEAFDFAFAGATGSMTPTPGPMMPSPAELARAQALRDSKKSVLDLVRGDVRTLQMRLPAGQKLKMDGALSAISELEKSLLGGGGSAGGPIMAAPVQCKDTAKIQQSVAEGTDEKQKQARIIANAFACDVSRIAVWKLVASADGGTPFGGYHNTSHETGTAAADAKLTQIEAWQATQVSYLAAQLKSVKDPLGTGSVFDNTIVFWFNECAHGNHDPSPLPLVLLGSGGGKIETGRILSPDNTQKKYGNLLVSLAHAMGDTAIKTIGDSNACNGPLQGLLKPGLSPA